MHDFGTKLRTIVHCPLLDMKLLLNNSRVTCYVLLATFLLEKMKYHQNLVTENFKHIAADKNSVIQRVT